MQNKKWISMLLAFVISVGLWVYIVTVENPEGDLTLYNIPVMSDGREVLRQDYNLLLKETITGEELMTYVNAEGKDEAKAEETAETQEGETTTEGEE